MKQFGLILLVSVISSVSSVLIYDYFHEDTKEIIKVQEASPVRYTNFQSPSPNTQNREVYYTAAPTDFTQAAEAVLPTVVNIRAMQGSKRSGGSFDDYWGGLSPGASSGSGVVIAHNGYIVTNYHVIEGANDIEVTLHDNRKFDAKIIGTDPSTDLAVIKINQKDLPYLSFGDSDSTRIGEWVLAVGNPFNLSSTVTAGIVSAKGRNINILEGTYKIESFIQTDAAVNPGNSGGALVNTNGGLIGINTAIITQSGRYEGYSFAVPSNLVQKVVNDLIEYGMVQRGFLGVTIENVNADIAKKAGLEKLEGIYIVQVNPNSAADDANMKRGDIITHINGIKVATMPELQEQVARYRPGDKLEVKYIRDEKTYSTTIILKDDQNRTTLTAKNSNQEQTLLKHLGIELKKASAKEIETLEIEGGVKVISVRKGSIIDRTNLTPGFIITKVNDVKVNSVEDVIKEIENTRKKVMLEGVYEDYPGEYYYAFAK